MRQRVMGVVVGFLFIILAGPALAQSGGGPGAGTGTTGAPITVDLDLPLEKPVFVSPTPTGPDPDPTPVNEEPPAPVPDDGGDDPQDEPPPVIYGEEIESENDTIFYVLDRSGSMDWDEASYTDLEGRRRFGTRMDRAKCELSRSILGLSQNFRFNIISYDCGTQRWQPSMVAATDANKQAALAWVQGQYPSGATGTGPAVVLALTERDNLCVVLLTDGEPNCGIPHWEGDEYDIETHRRVIRDGNLQRATINVFGIAASGQYRRFCQNVASDNGGSYFDVP